MGRKKTSKAFGKGIRFNPDVSERDRIAWSIIEPLLERGESFKDIMFAALFKAKGINPELYREARVELDEDSVRDIAEALIQHLSQMGLQMPTEQRGRASSRADEDEDEGSDLTKTLASSFMEQQLKRRKL